ncbi:hypothetical protein F511_34665 [Dorcoceras hygrometricum]|uniref:Dystroglycan-like n=1 Tax=Dorcoceras hygrometricum TaxID=472368 RepID=A0A2Z7AS73_9LAMI|nr:hypothetical protein F511_34665 [Dorcoceras hygrometricum]
MMLLKVSCSGGTVASSRGDNLRWRVPVDWCTSRKVYQSQCISRSIPVAKHQSQGTLTLYHSSEMASSLISRSHHIDFDSVFRFDDAGIVQMFESLVSTGLMEFLGCAAIFHEQALIEFFENGSVRDGMVVSVIGGMAVEISESVFAAAFGLPTEGLTDLSEVPRDLLSNAQKLFSASEKEVSISCLKKEVKMQYRLLSDILAKSLFVKVGSFDAVTRDRFLLMTAITFDVKINWGNILFGVLKEMVTPDSRQAKGFAIQICVLLKNIPGLELEVGDAPRAKTTPVKRTVSKKRPVSVDADVAPVIKKKRTTKSKTVAAKKLVLEEPIAAVPSTEEQIPVAGVATEEHIPVKEIATEDADATIRQVLTQLDLIFEKQDDVQGGRVETWFDRAFDEAFVDGDQEDQASEDLDQIFLELDTAGKTAGTMDVGESSKQTVASKRSFEELMSVDDLLVQICDDMMLPSITAAEISKIRIGESIDKGKGLLVEDEPIQRNPAQEAVELICGDVEFLVDLRDQRRKVDVGLGRDRLTGNGREEKIVYSCQSMEALRILQQEHGIIFEQPCTSTAFDYAVDCGAVFAQFFSVAKSTCWVRPIIFVDGIWTPLQGPDFWRSGCRLSLFLNKVEMPAPLFKIFLFTLYCLLSQYSTGEQPNFCQRLGRGTVFVRSAVVHTDCFAGYFGGSVVLSDSEILSDSSSGCTVYRSPSPVENPFALGPAIFSRVDQAEQLYFVQSPVSPPAAFSHQESSSSSSDVSIHFDSEDLPMRTPEAAHTSAPVDSNVSTAALDDLKSYFSQRIDESTTELRSKVNEVEFNVRGDLVKQQAWLRQVFQSACDILERQSTQINDLKKGLVAPLLLHNFCSQLIHRLFSATSDATSL